MKLLVLGGKGMAGHMITDYFSHHPEYDVVYTSRDQQDPKSIYLDVRNGDQLKGVIHTIKPNIVINTIGLLKEEAAENLVEAIEVNSLLPHKLVKLMDSINGKLIHISTDCVFSGLRGDYVEDGITDGITVYSKTKSLGEFVNNRHLTIRTSIIGPELNRDSGSGLFEWLMRQKGEVKGYKNVIWNGITTLELAKVIDRIIKQDITGLYHLVSKDKISKLHLLKLIQQVFNKKDIEIIHADHPILDRSLKNTREDFQYVAPNFKEMLVELNEWMQKQ
jgi:dTDP-4-dehydrorhamnose reductase